MSTQAPSKPTIEEMLAVWQEDYEEGMWEPISDITTGSWRHGSTKQFVAKRLSDNTYWCVIYRTTPSADYNDFREGDLDDSCVIQVVPVEVKKIEWRGIKR